MNVNLHIDSILLDGLDLAPGQTQLLQEAVAAHLTAMIKQRGISSSALFDFSNHASMAANSIQLSGSANATSLGPQLANVIYGNIPQSQHGPLA